jgi:hypothetical protein
VIVCVEHATVKAFFAYAFGRPTLLGEHAETELRAPGW